VAPLDENLNRLLSVSSPQERYLTRAIGLLGQRDQLVGTHVQAAFEVLSYVRHSTVGEIGEIVARGGTDSFRSFHLRDLRGLINRQAHTLSRLYNFALRNSLGLAWMAGERFPLEPLSQAGVTFIARDLPRQQLLLAQGMASDLVASMATDFQTAADWYVSLGVAGSYTPLQVMNAIGRLLSTEPDRNSRLGAIANQIERVVRTEMLAAFSLANLARLGQVVEQVHDLRKWWYMPDHEQPRQSHLADFLRYRPGSREGPILVGDDFVVDGERCSCPLDPRLTPGNRAYCRCVALAWRESWGEEMVSLRG